MSNDLNNIGEIFRNSLKDLKMDSSDQLWDKLDQRLASQPIVTPKKVFLQSSQVSWVSVAAAASLITCVAFASYYYVTKSKDTAIAKATQENIKTNIANNSKENTLYIATKDSANTASSTNDNKIDDITKITPKNSNIIENSNGQNITKRHNEKDVNGIIKNNNPNNNIQQQNPNSNSNTQPQLTNNNGFNPVNYNQSPLNSVNNANNSKTIKPNITTNNNQTTLHSNPIKVIAPKDTAKDISTDNANATNRLDPTVKPEVDINDVKIPNIFTPNADGYNDYFVIVNIDNCSNTELTISDRYGKIVYEKSNYQNDWDGRGLPDGVYFYTFKYTLHNAKTFKNGCVSIRR